MSSCTVEVYHEVYFLDIMSKLIWLEMELKTGKQYFWLTPRKIVQTAIFVITVYYFLVCGQNVHTYTGTILARSQEVEI